MSNFTLSGYFALQLLAGGSFITWGLVYARWHAGEPVLPSRGREQTPWPLGAGLRAFAVAFFVPFLFLLIPTEVLRALPFTEDGRKVIVLCISSVLQIVMTWAWLTLETGAHWQRIIGLSPIRWLPDLTAATFGFLASLVPVFGINLLIVWLGWHTPNERHPLLEMLNSDDSALLFAGVAISAAILAPLAEELMYRVALQTELERYMSENAALVTTAVIFAGVHSLSGRLDALPLFPLALILGYVYRQTRSYPATVALHGLFNGLNLAMTLVLKSAA